MLFQTFSLPRALGGSDYIELQYCSLPPGTRITEMVSCDAIRHWVESSLYVSGEDMGEFYAVYGAIFAGGVYQNLARGPVDLCGINYYTGEQTRKIRSLLEADRPPEYRTLLDWLNAAQNGFYILGL